MAEISEISARHRTPIDPLAFTLALVLAPFFVAGAGFWILFIPIVAVPFGIVPYLLFGMPLLMWGLHRGLIGVWPGAVLGAGGWVLMCLSLALLHLAGHAEQEFVRIYAFFGLPMSVLWGAAFGLLYPRMRRSFYRNPV